MNIYDCYLASHLTRARWLEMDGALVVDSGVGWGS